MGRVLVLSLLLWSTGLAKQDCNDDFFLDVTKNKCIPCKMCEGIFEYKQKCSKTTDAICRCTARYQCSGNESVCKECICESGEQLTDNGCQSCPDGEFYDQVGGRCRPWTKCSGDRILANGSRTKDVKCQMVPEGTDVTSTIPVTISPAMTERDGQLLIISIALTVALLLCVLSLLTLSITFRAWAKRKLLTVFVKPEPIGRLAQEVDDCSCRYPEEEEGGGEGQKEELLEKHP